MAINLQRLAQSALQNRLQFTLEQVNTRYTKLTITNTTTHKYTTSYLDMSQSDGQVSIQVGAVCKHALSVLVPPSASSPG